MEFSQEHRIYTLEQLQRQIKIWKLKDDIITFTNGCFDILHRGHAEYLNKAARLGDRLIVALNSDVSVRGLKGDNRPLQAEADRAYVLASLHAVDAVVMFDDSTPEALIREIAPDILVKGGDYTEDAIVGADLVKSRGGKVEIIPLVAGYSTSAIAEKIRSQS